VADARCLLVKTPYETAIDRTTGQEIESHQTARASFVFRQTIHPQVIGDTAA